jgi:tryptophan synthase beta subunit
MKVARSFGRDGVLLVNVSGRGDKDVQTVEQQLKGQVDVAN